MILAKVILKYLKKYSNLKFVGLIHLFILTEFLHHLRRITQFYIDFLKKETSNTAKMF